jgi:peptidyl-prolyl cis-trans isomerase C
VKLQVVLAASLGLVLLAGCNGSETVPVEISTADPGDPGRVVAEVNGSSISAQRVDRVVQADLLSAGGEQGRDRLQLRRDALTLVINGELLFQAAKADGIGATEPEIDAQLEAISSQFGTADEFERHLLEAGMTVESMRARVERRLVTGVYAQSITNELELDETHARQLYEERKQDYTEGAEVRVAQIIVRALPTATAERRAQARSRIEDAERRLKAGEDFAELAREYSESPYADRGGDLGFIPRGRALPEFERVIFDTAVGQTTPIFETPHGFNIVRVLDRREASVPEFEEVRTALLMVLAREQHDTVLQDHVQQLRAAASIKIHDPELRTE